MRYEAFKLPQGILTRKICKLIFTANWSDKWTSLLLGSKKVKRWGLRKSPHQKKEGGRVGEEAMPSFVFYFQIPFIQFATKLNLQKAFCIINIFQPYTINHNRISSLQWDPPLKYSYLHINHKFKTDATIYYKRLQPTKHIFIFRFLSKKTTQFRKLQWKYWRLEIKTYNETKGLIVLLK